MDAAKLYEMMKKVQEPKGYYFNTDKERTFELLEALLINKERYGYMGCPCRLLCGDRTHDKDIICIAAPDTLQVVGCATQLRDPVAAIVMNYRTKISNRIDVTSRAAPDATQILGGIALHRAPVTAVVVQDIATIPDGKGVVT